MDRYSIANLTDRYLRGSDKYPHSQQSILDQRRMSEPAMFGSTAGPYTSSAADLASARYHQLQHEYAPSYSSSRSYSTFTSSSLHRTLSSGSVRDHHHPGSWKDDPLPLHSYDGVELDEPISPLNPTFSGGEGSPAMGMHGLPYGLGDDYGPSPPGTGTSTSSNAPGMQHGIHSSPGGGVARSNSNSKQYSFVSLPGNAVKKRPRRRYDEIERLYQCSWPDCTKAYGTLNHLNAHVTMQKHGAKRSPNEFKDLRKQWRKAKKEESDARALGMRVGQPSRHPQRNSLTETDLQSYRMRPHLQGSVEDLRYPPDELDAQAHQDEVYARRQQRFSAFHSPAARNHPGAGYISSSAPVPQHLSSVVMNRLPPNSTLLTPLPGYEGPAITGAPEVDSYNPYDIYADDIRPGSGHGSIGGYIEDRRRSSVFTDDGRPRSSHSSLRGAQDQEYREL
ncbi:hypothetical protein BJ138DRAFT_1001365 [Hygrophoropsis aurantiaca]|uniref:Uncharacterized protein n=1 Tax=Hygrophoropsis aurantiaca TaxID=72124 RepID=A0ACB8AKR5_9AGAM|nr:hypothetical protein BJ138DRAFT_1001365 [Hygrophoropsis aurantiaca]